LQLIEERCSSTEYQNWIAPIRFLDGTSTEIRLEVPNVFVQQYLLENYKKELATFFPLNAKGDPAIVFVIAEQLKVAAPLPAEAKEEVQEEIRLNPQYIFDNFIEGPSNQFVKSAALGIAHCPGKTYNPLFIHGGVGLGKTHLLHSVGHSIRKTYKKLRVQCVTTETFINDLVEHLRNKSLDKMKKYYRSLDVLLLDDIQFLQGRSNFEEEMCNTLESLIQQGKQIVITSDKPPGQLKLSERMIARMEWGLVAQIAPPDFETRVAILQHKADLRGILLPRKVAYFIAERIFNNVRQLEGALNRLTAYCKLMGLEITEEVVEKTLSELFQRSPEKKVSIETILSSVATIYDVRVSDLKSTSRSKNVAFPRQVAMYLAKELLSDSLIKLASAFGGKTHSTLLHAWKKINKQLENDEQLKQQIQIAKSNIHK
jgi:chromosomal replication initiator protein